MRVLSFAAGLVNGFTEFPMYPALQTTMAPPRNADAARAFYCNPADKFGPVQEDAEDTGLWSKIPYNFIQHHTILSYVCLKYFSGSLQPSIQRSPRRVSLVRRQVGERLPFLFIEFVGSRSRRVSCRRLLRLWYVRLRELSNVPALANLVEPV